MGNFVGRGNLYTQLVKVLYCKLPTLSKKLHTIFPAEGSKFEPPTSEVGGKCVTTTPPWSPNQDVKGKFHLYVD